MQQTRLFLYVALCIWLYLVASGCSHTPQRTAPTTLSWLEHTPTEFATDAYITALGSGATPEQAADHARASIAKLFSVRVRHTSYHAQHIDAQDQAEAVRTYGSKSNRTLTDQVLQGVPIVRQGLRTTDNRWYALAALEKRTMARQLRTDMDTLDARITDRLNHLATATPLGRVRILKRAQDLMQQRTRELKRYQVIAQLPYPSQHANYSFANALQQARANATIAVHMADTSPENRPNTQATVINILQENGYQVTQTGTYTLLVTEQRLPLVHRKPWYWQKAYISWELCERATNQCTSNQITVRAAATQPDTLSGRTHEQLRQALPAPLLSTLEGNGASDSIVDTSSR